jgi:hypothetical protein
MKSNRDGVPEFIGTDEFNHQIFLLNFGADLKLGLQTVCFYLQEHSNPLDWKFFNITTEPDSFWIGGRILLELKMIGMGRKMIMVGIQKYYNQISNQVKKAKELCKNLG